MFTNYGKTAGKVQVLLSAILAAWEPEAGEFQVQSKPAWIVGNLLEMAKLDKN